VNKRLFNILWVVVCMGILGIPLSSTRGQATGASITILSQDRKSITKLTDGDTIRLRLELTAKVAQETVVSFRLPGLDVDVAGCTIRVGQSSCESEPFASLGWFWNPGGHPQPERVVQAWVKDSIVATSSTLQVASRPVVMVHGFSSSWEAWATYLGPQGYLATAGLHGFAVGDGQAPGVMNTGSLTNPTGRTNTIAEDAAILRSYIEAVRQQTGAQKIDLVAHSLGGLIARYYIDRLMPDGEVVNLIMLGSPMTGTSCANLPAALGFYLPAVLEFQPLYVQEIFNPQITHRRGVIFSALAGVPLINPIQSPCTPVPSDIAVSRDSVEGIPMEVAEMPILHTELNTSVEVFHQFVLPHLQAVPGSFTAPPDPTIPAPNPERLQFTHMYTGHVNPGEATDLTIHIDANVSVASFALYDHSHSLSVQVTGASGKVITLDPVTNGLIQVNDPTSLVYLGYGFNNPKPGAWLVKLIPTDETPTAGADYALTAVFQGGAVLMAQTSAMTPPLNDPVLLTAHLELNGQTLAISQAKAIVRFSDGSLQTIALGQVSDTNDAQATWNPTQSGLYGIEINASGLAPDGFTIDRTAFLTVEVQPRPLRTTMGVLILVGVLALVLLVLVGLIITLRRRKLWLI